MSFLSSNSPPQFFSESQHELEFRERMRRLEKRQNEFASKMTNEEAYKFTQWIINRILFCYRCNEQFYSAAGMVNHRCV